MFKLISKKIIRSYHRVLVLAQSSLADNGVLRL